MTGAELVIGGWFASAVIGKFVNKADEYLGGNRLLHKEANKMLDNLKNKLSPMLAIVEDAEKQRIENEGLKEWLQRIKDAAYEAEDVLDDFEAKSDAIRVQLRLQPALSQTEGLYLEVQPALSCSDPASRMWLEVQLCDFGPELDPLATMDQV